MAITKTSPKYFLGTQIPNIKILSSKIDELIEAIDAAASPNATNAFATIADV